MHFMIISYFAAHQMKKMLQFSTKCYVTVCLMVDINCWYGMPVTLPMFLVQVPGRKTKPAMYRDKITLPVFGTEQMRLLGHLFFYLLI